jgi:nicotinamide-nucleotide amidase
VSDLEVAKSVVKKLSKIRKSLSVAESITGGGLGQVLTQIPGASKVFVGGVITYSDELKVSELSVSKSDLKKYSAVSEEIAIAMAKGALKKFKTDFAVSTTGVAGPGAAYGQKAGTAWIGVVSKKEAFAINLSLPGKRDVIRHAIIASALAALERILKP